MLFKWLLSVAVLCVANVNAQFVVDAAGPHNILLGSEKLKDKNTWQFGLDSANRSISIGYLRGPGTNESDFVYAFAANVGAAKDTKIQDVWNFDVAPAIGATAAIHWSPPMTRDGWKPFANLGTTYAYETYRYLDNTRPGGNQLYKPGFHHSTTTLTLGTGFPRPNGSPWDLGTSVSVGYERLVNAEDLPLYDLTDPTNVVALPGVVGLSASKANKSARFGQIKAVNAFPLSASFVAKVPSGWFDKTVKWFRWTPDGPNERYELIPGVYGRGLIRDSGKPDHAIGLTLTMRRITDPKDAKDEFERIKGQKWTYPLHIFLEAKNVFGSKKDELRAGTAILISIP